LPGFQGQTCLYLFQSFNALSFSIILGAPMVLFTTWLGGGSGAVGLVSSIMPFLTVLQIPSIKYISKWGYRRTMMAGWTSRTLVLLGIVALPFFKGAWSPEQLIGFLALCIFIWSLMRGMTNASWFPWIRALVPQDQRGRFFAGESRYIQLMSLAILFFSGLILGSNPNQWRFSLLFSISFMTGMISLFFLSRIPSVDVPHEERHITSTLKNIREALGSGNYKRYLLYVFIFTVANGGFDAFTVLFLKRESGFSERNILWLGACSSGGMILVLFFIGKILDQWGSKPIMKLCLSAVVFYQGIWFLLSQKILPLHYPGLIFLYLVTGFIRASIGIAITRLTMISAPRKAVLMALAIYTTGTGILSGVTPLGWGLILDRIDGTFVNSFGYFFLAGILLNLFAFILLDRVREEKAESARNVAFSLLLQPMQALIQLMSFFPRIQNIPQETGQDKQVPEEAETSARNSDN
jgi:MFS family permease